LIRWIAIRVLIGLVVGLSWQVARAETPDQVVAIVQERAAAYGVDAGTLTRIVRCESQLGQQLVGDYGHSHGPVQLSDLPTGLLCHFQSLGYSSAYDVWSSVDYLARVASGEFAGQGITLRRWSCYGR
jgi:hypothetical protein